MSAAPADAAADHGYLRGRGLVLLAGVCMSIGGPLIRLIEHATEWQFLVYRALGLVATLLLVLAARRGVRAAFRRAGWNGIAAGLCLATAFVGFVFSITHTTVANTLFLLSASPFLAAVLSRLLLGETVSRATWRAMLGAAAGVALMVWEGVSGGALFGNLTGLGAALGFAGFSVALRRGRTVDMLPAVCVAGAASALVSAAAALLLGTGLAVPAWDLGLSLTYGVVGVGAGLWLYTLGSRHLPAAELTLLSLTEVVLGPVWVWLGFGEVPSPLTLLGGVVLLGALAGQALSGVVRRPRPPPAIG